MEGRKYRRFHTVVIGTVLLAACSADEEPAHQTVDLGTETVPVAFDCSVRDGTRAAGGPTGIITQENYLLRYYGIGVFACQADDEKPDFMYNQKVEYNLLAQNEDVTNNGYWTYQPLKYWPTDISDLQFCAYAPYVDKPQGLPADATGIVGMSPNTSTIPYIIYARTRKLDQHVDLLWGYLKPTAKGTIRMKMSHALARVAVGLTLTEESTVPPGTKVLVERITLSGQMAERGKLDLTSHAASPEADPIPLWTEQETAPATIYIDHDPETYTDSYGNLAESVRHIKDLPYAWQPAGLQKNVPVSVLCLGDHQSYIYLIPQEELLLNCTVKLCLFASDGTKTTVVKTTTDGAAVRVPEASPGDPTPPLRGNTTYHLNLSVTL